MRQDPPVEPGGPPSPTVDDLERITARSWRGLEEEKFGDWSLRAAGGFTGRANSALVVGDPPVPLDAAVATVAEWYRRRGLRPQAQVPLPGAEAADAAFEAAGWERGEEVLVLTAALRDWPGPGMPVDLDPAPDAGWLAGYRYRGTPLPAVAADVLTRAERPVFASVRPDPAPAPLAAVARGVLIEDWLCVTAVTVDDRHRRRGLATAVMAALGAWARADGGSRCVLQVAASNAPAIALYDRLGFTEHHRYHYRLAA
jgi:GNAT superfamily N-acetyltransferase